MPPFKVALVANDLPPTPDWVAPTLAEQGIEFVERCLRGGFRSRRNSR